jgi:antitoxin (DNA-binding transcriptional repressor) of toxin-antitoxin stability system
MKQRRIGIRQLKSTLSRCLHDVKRGATIVVTDRGRGVARIVQEADSLAERVDTLRNAGSIEWSGRRLNASKPLARVRGTRTVSAIMVENRE